MRLLAYRSFGHTIHFHSPSHLKVLFNNRNGQQRGIINNKQLITYIQNYSNVFLQVTNDTSGSFIDQVRSVFSIDLYISIHGAALTHILFMEPLSALIEINPPYFREPYYRNMAFLSRILYYGIFSTYTNNMNYSMSLVQTDKKLNQQIVVPLRLFHLFFDLATSNIWKYKYQCLQ